ncbi:MAG: hypothetical protein E6575_14810, partial [Bradyrhizobium sp.]|nr:hypothetical protein [Bradyrhizobium sp.]
SAAGERQCANGQLAELLLQAVSEAARPVTRARSTSGPETHALKGVSEEDPGANQAHHCGNCFDHSEHILLRPARRKRRAALHSQNDSGPGK